MKTKLICMLLAFCTAAAFSTGVCAEETAGTELDADTVLDDGNAFSFFARQFGTEEYYLTPRGDISDWLEAYDTSLSNPMGAGLNFDMHFPMVRNAAFVLCSEDQLEAVQAIVQQYFPQQSDGSMRPFSAISDPNTYILWDHKDADAKRISETYRALCTELAKADLISAFYHPEQIWCTIPINVPYLTGYFDDAINGGNAFDAEAVQAYLDSEALACSIQTEQAEGHTLYFVVPDDETDVQAHLQLAAQLYDALGIVPDAAELPVSTFPQFNLDALEQGQITGKQYLFFKANALALTGDVNLDQSVTVADAVLLARVVAEDSTAQVTEAGLANADVNGDSTADANDTTALLKMIANR